MVLTRVAGVSIKPEGEAQRNPRNSSNRNDIARGAGEKFGVRRQSEKSTALWIA